MFIAGVQMAGDQAFVGLIEFIGNRLEEITTGMKMDNKSVDASLPLEESYERERWDEGYLAALNDIVAFIQGLNSRAAA
ncbi:MAG TPA: hypothetical protein VNZ47_00655 [Candidatus Dormibacteraeota bacterium]|jgi:hypothetical protein|nr:hypothetical protein [Candidatus Dormibacteraeota bacterium]